MCRSRYGFSAELLYIPVYHHQLRTDYRSGGHAEEYPGDVHRDALHGGLHLPLHEFPGPKHLRYWQYHLYLCNIFEIVIIVYSY